jgi:hypothetical protein
VGPVPNLRRQYRPPEASRPTQSCSPGWINSHQTCFPLACSRRTSCEKDACYAPSTLHRAAPHLLYELAMRLFSADSFGNICEHFSRISPINNPRLPSQPGHLKGANQSGSSNHVATVVSHSRFSPEPLDEVITFHTSCSCERVHDS